MLGYEQIRLRSPYTLSARLTGTFFYKFLNTLKARTLGHFLLLYLGRTNVTVPESVPNIASQQQISNWFEHKRLTAVFALVSPLLRALRRFFLAGIFIKLSYS